MTQQMISIPLLSGAALHVPHDVAAPILMAALTGQTPPVVQAAPRLEWSDTLCDGKKVNHAEAEKAAAALGDGWRLPTIDELLALVDRSRCEPAIDVARFPDTKSTWYWTSTQCAWNTSAVWVVDFYLGYSGDYFRHFDGCVRAVRSSPSGQ